MITAKKMRRLEKQAEKRGISRLQLMELAGRNIAEVLKRKMAFIEHKQPRILFVCHHGNNGGDGLAAARYLANEVRNAAVTVLLVAEKEDMTKEARINLERLAKRKDVSIIEEQHPMPAYFAASDIIVDCMFGTGFRGTLDQHMQNIVTMINEAKAKRVSVDIPTGIDAKGRPAPFAVNADLIIALHDSKPGCDPEKTLVVQIGL